MATTLTYTSNSTLSVTASFISASVQCWGAGGHGGLTGVGGSGGAYASSSIVFLTGSYPIYVGQATSTDGGNSYITSGSTNVVVIRAAGGKQDGTISHQASLNTGSIKYLGGAGSSDFNEYASYNGSGGGGAAGSSGNGSAGKSASTSDFYNGASGGAAGTGGGNGGSGAYYYSGAGVNQVYGASAGAAPGGGGGGGYDYGTSNSGGGANGKIIIRF